MDGKGTPDALLLGEPHTDILGAAMVGTDRLLQYRGDGKALKRPPRQAGQQRPHKEVSDEKRGRRMAWQPKHQLVLYAAQEGGLARLHGNSVKQHIAPGLNDAAGGVLAASRGATGD